MSLRILGGAASGAALFVPKGDIIRPTSVMLRRRVFDWRQDWEGWTWVDVYAGTGAMGIEAMSRGAKQLFANEKERDVYKILEKNIELIKKRLPDGQFHLSQKSADIFLKYWLDSHSSLDSQSLAIYIDPPYEKKELYLQSLDLLRERKFSGEIWVESCQKKGIKKDWLSEQLSLVIKSFDQGDSYLLVGRL